MRQRARAALWIVLIGATAGLIVAAWTIRNRRASPASTTKVAKTIPPAAAGLNPQQLVERIKELHEEYAQDDTLRDQLVMGAQLAKRAVELDPKSGDGWAAYARMELSLVDVDPSTDHLAVARSCVQHAVEFAPDSTEVRLAQAELLRKAGGAGLAESERILRDLAIRAPSDKRVLRLLALLLRQANRPDEALVFLDRAIAAPGGDAKALLTRAQILFAKGEYAAAEASVDRSLALHVSIAGRLLKLSFLTQRGELEAARTLLQTIPPSSLTEDRGAYYASLLWLWSRHPERSVAVLRATPRPILEGMWIDTVPKGYLLGRALLAAGHADAAKAEFTSALQAVDERLIKTPNDRSLHRYRAILLAFLDQPDAAAAALKTYQQLEPSPNGSHPGLPDCTAAEIDLALGRRDDAVTQLAAYHSTSPSIAFEAWLRFDPELDILRGDDRFRALLSNIAAKN